VLQRRVLTPPVLTAIGAGIGLLVLLHIRNAGLALGFMAVVSGRLSAGGMRRLVAFIWPIAVVVAIRTAINWRFWGSFVLGPHASFADGSVTGGMREAAIRSLGLLTDQEHGLLICARVYLLALPGFFLMRRSRRQSHRPQPYRPLMT
jgi:hypothetical protein